MNTHFHINIHILLHNTRILIFLNAVQEKVVEQVNGEHPADIADIGIKHPGIDARSDNSNDIQVDMKNSLPTHTNHYAQLLASWPKVLYLFCCSEFFPSQMEERELIFQQLSDAYQQCFSVA